ncbi:hypothetical protein BT69DRAFT_1293401 [Atractiella rhizophila]|nr:hypothetical protein BT69DRAFT_1293401 [Atractiella rhizophila]
MYLASIHIIIVFEQQILSKVQKLIILHRKWIQDSITYSLLHANLTNSTRSHTLDILLLSLSHLPVDSDNSDQQQQLPIRSIVHLLWHTFSLSTNYQPLLYRVTSLLTALLKYSRVPACAAIWDIVQDAPFAKKRTLVFLSEILPHVQQQQQQQQRNPQGQESAFGWEQILQRHGRLGLWEMAIDLLHKTEVANLLSRVAASWIGILCDPDIGGGLDIGERQRVVDCLSQCVLDRRRRAAATTYLLKTLAKDHLELLSSLYERLESSTAEGIGEGISDRDANRLESLLSISKLCPTEFKVPPSLLTRLTLNRSYTLRASAFSLLVTSYPSPDPNLPFSSLSHTILQFLITVAVEDRAFIQEVVVQSIPMLINKFRSTPSSIANGGLPNERKQLLHAIWTRSLLSLNPLSPFRVHATSLRILASLLESGLDPAYRNITPLHSQERRWSFSLDLVTPELACRLVMMLLSSYTELRAIAGRLLSNLPSSKLNEEGEKVIVFAERDLIDFRERGRRMARSSRESEARGGVQVLGLVFSKLTNPQERVELVASLLSDLNSQMDVAERSIVEASEKGPMFGTLAALAHLLGLLISLPEAAAGREGVEIMKGLVDDCWKVVKRAWAVVQVVLCDPAPEGLDLQDDFEVLTSEGSREKKILATTWRTMKGVGELVETLIIAPMKAKLEFNDSERLEETASLFFSWFTTIRHSGAFSSLYPNFEKICNTLVVTSHSTRAALQSWLDRSIDFILEDAASRTRRSGGIPFCLLGPLTSFASLSKEAAANSNRKAAKPHQGVNLFQNALQRLFLMASDNSLTVNVRVNAYNSLRAIFQSSKCATDTVAFVEQGFRLSFSGFWKEEWAIRNSSLLLYSAVTQRVFNKVRESRDNRLLVKDFSNQYPSLLPMLGEELNRAVKVNLDDFPTADLQSSLYSVLLLLTNLRTLNHNDNIPSCAAALIPSVEECGKSRVMKIREVASIALACLVSPDQSISHARRIFKPLPKMRQNELHGRLNQIFRLLQNVMEDGQTPTQELELFSTELLRFFECLFLERSMAPTILNSAMDIIKLLPLSCIPLSLIELFTTFVKTYPFDDPGTDSLLSNISAFLLDRLKGRVASTLLESDRRPLMRSTFQWLSQQPPTTEFFQTIEHTARYGPADLFPNALNAMQAIPSKNASVLKDFLTLLKERMGSKISTVRQAILPVFSRLLVTCETRVEDEDADFLLGFVEEWSYADQVGSLIR